MSIESVMPSTISSSVTPYSCLQFFPASGSFPVSQFFASGGQSIGASASASVLPINIQDWFHLGLNGLISLQSKRLFKHFLQYHSSKASILQHSTFFMVQLSHPYVTTGKTIALTRRIFVSKVMSLLFNMMSRVVITFLPRSKRLLISWLQSPSAAFSLSQSDLGAPKNKICYCIYFPPFSLPLSDVTRSMMSGFFF